ncbi:hypothetical protein MO973_19495 [Paenibacillus sp. TRM 82003]|nr:hypothetical protein [Paenibacillus sp. TRM 82003]
MARKSESDALEIEAKKLGYELLECNLTESMKEAPPPVRAVLVDQVKEIKKRREELKDK